MKVFENIEVVVDKYEQLFSRKYARSYVVSELNRILRELIPIRCNKEATRYYFHNNLRHDFNVRQFEHTKAIHALNGIKVKRTEYRPCASECDISEDILHPILRDIIEPERYSFGHLYWLLCSEYNRSVGYAFYNDIVVSDAVISYAVKFDIEELKNINLDLIDTLDHIDLMILDSKSYEFGSEDPVLLKLKARFESYAEGYKALLENKLDSFTEESDQAQTGQVKEIPLYRNSIGYEEDPPKFYLCYFDFTECPINLSNYPFQIHLGKYSITRTKRGLEDANPIFLDIISKELKLICETYTGDGHKIFDSTRELLGSLFNSFMNHCEEECSSDYKKLTTFAKWWALNANRCIDTCLFTRFPIDDYDPMNPKSTPNFMKSEWNDSVFFTKVMKEYCLYLVIYYIMHMKCHPFKQIFSIVPFNYYKDEFTAVEAKANGKKVRDENDRIVLDFMSNCKYLRTYLKQQLSQLDGMDINDGESISVRHSIISDIMWMFNDYICRIDAIGIRGFDAQKYCFDIWKWLVCQMLENIINQTTIEFPASMKGVSNVNSHTYYLKSSLQYDSFHKAFNNSISKAERDFMTDLLKNMHSEKKCPGDDSDRYLSPFESKLNLFSQYVVNSIDAKSLFEYLTNKITSKNIKGVKAFVYIDAVVRLGYISHLPYNIAIACLGNIGSVANYNKYVGKNATFKENIESIEEDIQNVLKTSS